MSANVWSASLGADIGEILVTNEFPETCSSFIIINVQ